MRRALLHCALALASIPTPGCDDEDEGPLPPTPPTLGAGFVEVPYPVPEGFAPPGLISNDNRGLTGGVVADLDGQGDNELLLGAVEQDGWTGAAIAFRFDRTLGTLSPVSLPSVDARTMPLAALDLDGDGHTDLLNNLPALAWGLGEGRFTTPMRLLSIPVPDRRTVQIMGAAVEDLDGDGWLDLLIGQRTCCSRCRSFFPLLRTGLRSFTERVDLVPDAPGGGAYAVLASRLDASPMVLATLSACAPSEPAFFREMSRDAEGYPRFGAFDPARPDAEFRRGSDPSGCVSMACRAPMGAWVGYIDEDDRLDLAVSLNPRRELFRGGATFPLQDVRTSSRYTVVPGPETGRGMIPWGVAFIDLDRDGRPDAINVHGNDFIPDEDRARYIGPQFTTVHWNAGGFRFADITALTNLGRRRAQWRALLVDDFDHDGDADLVVGGHGAPPVIYRNDIRTPNSGFSLALRGTTSNRLGLGARVSVEVGDGAPPRRFFMGGMSSPHNISAPLIFVGLGTAARAARVTVSWPSGVVSVARDLVAGRLHTLEEPGLFTLEPSSRHLPADGRSELLLRITPRDANGAARSASAVQVVPTHGGEGVAVSVLRDGDDAWIARVRAPLRAGSTRLEVRVDGVASEVRPRVWWDAP